MTRDVITVSEDDTLARALQVFQHEHITGAPVVNAQGRLVGILSLADLLPQTESDAAEAKPANEAEKPREGLQHSNRAAWQLLREHPTLGGNLPDGVPAGHVRERMSSDVVFVRDIAPLIEAARIMCVGHWHRVPVVDAYDKLCGIVSTMDVLAALVNAADEPG
jgi:CBS-domain-containing membrane protein